MIEHTRINDTTEYGTHHVSVQETMLWRWDVNRKSIEANTTEDRRWLLCIRNGDTGIGIRLYRSGKLIFYTAHMSLINLQFIVMRVLHVSIQVTVNYQRSTVRSPPTALHARSIYSTPPQRYLCARTTRPE